MKIFAIIVLTLVAQIYFTHGSTWERNDRTAMRSSWSSQADSSEERQDSRSSQTELFNELQVALRDTRPTGRNQFHSSASQLPQAESFKTKVINRLHGSDFTPELKQKFINVADQKLENCKTPTGNELDKHCVGRLTGQMMQLIAATEKISRPIAGAHSVNHQSEAQRRQFEY